MATGEVLLPEKAYNPDLLHDELKDALGVHSDGVRSRKGRFYAVLFDTAPAGSDTTAKNVANAHNANGVSLNQEIAADGVTKREIVAYIRSQMVLANPASTATIKATVQAFIDTSPRLQNAVTNIAGLYGYNTGTNVGYLQAALQVISWLP